MENQQLQDKGLIIHVPAAASWSQRDLKPPIEQIYMILTKYTSACNKRCFVPEWLMCCYAVCTLLSVCFVVCVSIMVYAVFISLVFVWERNNSRPLFILPPVRQVYMPVKSFESWCLSVLKEKDEYSHMCVG